MRFTQKEWAFHRIAPPELHAAWVWEIHREAGEKLLPWLRLGDACRRAVRDYFAADFTVREYDLERHGALAALPLAIEAATLGGEVIHALRVNWSVGLPRVLEALRVWAECEAQKHPELGTFAPKKGRQNQHAAWLEDLAITRAHASGLRGRKITDQLAPLFNANAPKNPSRSKEKPEHQLAACRNTAARVEEIRANPCPLSALFPEGRLR